VLSAGFMTRLDHFRRAPAASGGIGPNMFGRRTENTPGTAADTPHTQTLPPSRPSLPLHAFPQTVPLRTAQPRPRPPMWRADGCVCRLSWGSPCRRGA